MNPTPLHNHLWPGRGSNVRCLALLSVLCFFGWAIPAMAVPSPHIIRIVLVGDSTVADSSGWGLGFKCRVDPQKAQCINLAAGGRSSLSYLREKRWDDALGLKADYYLIQFGHNDQPGKPGVSTEPGVGYRQCLIRYVEEAKAAGSQPVLITPLTRREFGRDGKIHSSLAPYATVMRQVAMAEHVPVVDLQAASIALCDKLGKEGCVPYSAVTSAGKPDGTHLNTPGGMLFGGLVVEGLQQAAPALADCFLAQPVAVSNLPPPAIYDVADFGARGDGVADDTHAIQSALDGCWHGGGGVVRVTKGRYRMGPLHLHSQCALQLDQGALLLASDRHADYAGVHALISGDNLTGVSITGEGVIDGAGSSWWAPVREAKKLGLPEPEPRPRLVMFSECVYVKVQGVTLQNSPSFHLVPVDCENVDIQGVRIVAPANAPNTDGIDPISSRYVRIQNCFMDTGDDNIAIKSSHVDAAHPGGAAEHILVENCTFLHGHGMSIGSKTIGGVRDVLVAHCTFDGTTSGIRVKSARERGGPVEGLVYQDLTMHNVEFPIFLAAYYPKVPSQDTARPRTPETPVYHDIRIERVTGLDCGTAGILAGLPESPIFNVVFNHVHLESRTGMTLRQAMDIHFYDSSLKVGSGPVLQIGPGVTGNGLGLNQ